MEKFLAMNVAALLTQAASAGAGGSLTLDPELKDNNVRAKNLQVWETFRVFYHAVVKAMADATWPSPTIDGVKLLPGLLNGLGTDSPLAGVLGKLIQAIPTPATPPKGPLPDPGATPAPRPA